MEDRKRDKGELSERGKGSDSGRQKESDGVQAQLSTVNYMCMSMSGSMLGSLQGAAGFYKQLNK